MMKYVLLTLLFVSTSSAQFGTRNIGADSTWFKYLLIQDGSDTAGFSLVSTLSKEFHIDAIPTPNEIISLILGHLTAPAPLASKLFLQSGTTSSEANQISFQSTNGSSFNILQDTNSVWLYSGVSASGRKAPIIFQMPGGTEFFKIDTSNKIGIGAPTIDSQLTVQLGLHVNRGVRFNKDIMMDSIANPATPPQATATSFVQGIGKFMVKYSDGSVHNLDSTGAGGNHNILSSTHSDATTSSVVSGDLMVGNATPQWTKLSKGAANTIAQINQAGTLVGWNTSLNLSSVADPGPTPGVTYIYALDDSVSGVIVQRDSIGKKRYFGESTWRFRRPMSLWPNTRSVSTVDAYGFPGSSVVAPTGTWTAVAVDVNGSRRNLPSGTSTNNESGFDFFTTNDFRAVFEMDVTVKCKIVTTTSRRWWFGFFASTPMASDAPTIAHIGIRLSTSAGSTNFVLSMADGTTQSETSLMATDALVHTFRLVIDDVNSRAGVSVDGKKVIWQSTNYPLNTTSLGLCMRLRTLTTAAANMDWWWIDGSSAK